MPIRSLGDNKSASSSLDDCDIVKMGYLFIKRPPTSMRIRLKTWQKRFLVLRDDVREKCAHLEIYASETGWSSRRDKYVINLQHVLLIEDYNASKAYTWAFTMIRRGQAPLVLGAESEYEMKEWMVALKLLAGKTRVHQRLSLPVDILPESLPPLPWQRKVELMRRLGFDKSSPGSSPRHSPSPPPRPLQSRDTLPAPPDGRGNRVQIQPTDSSGRLGLSGLYLMLVTSTKITLRRLNSLDDVITWPIINILKLKSEEAVGDYNGDIVTLEAGVMCGDAKGTFLFKTQTGKELIRRVRLSVNKLSTSRNSVHDPEFELCRARTSRSRLSKCDSDPGLVHIPRGVSPELMQISTSMPSNDTCSLPPYLTIIDDEDEQEKDELENEDNGPSYLEVINDEIPEVSDEDCDDVTPSTGSVSHRNPPIGQPRRQRQQPGIKLPERKDSGFSESFDEVRGGSLSDSQMDSNNTPPVVPPRPRHTFLHSVSSPVSCRPLPPLPSAPS